MRSKCLDNQSNQQILIQRLLVPGTILGAGKFSHEWRLVPTVMKLTFRSGQYTFWNEGRGKKMLLSESAIQFQKRSERVIFEF